MLDEDALGGGERRQREGGELLIEPVRERISTALVEMNKVGGWLAFI